MNDAEVNILKMLFEEHHRQLANKRQKIHGITERTLAIYLIIAGWLIFTKDPMTPGVRWVIICVVIVFALVSSWSVYVNNRSYYAIARVVRRLNDALGLYEIGKFIPDESVYPSEWKLFGEYGERRGALSHTLAILAGAALCAFAAYLRTY